jgi:hypothetical protein
MLENVWVRLHDRPSSLDSSKSLVEVTSDRPSSLDSSTSLVEVNSDYAAHFYDMYAESHTGKHLTGDGIRILLLNLPFVFHDLIAPEVMFTSTLYHKMAYIMHDII